jgi:hypothetical protein
MTRGLSHDVKNNIEKCRFAAIAAVDAYNRPGPRFRTAQYLILLTISWTAIFHAIFYSRGRRPWYRVKAGTSGKGTRYLKVDGEPKHWDLSECIKQYFGGQNPPERKNLEFVVGLRNKIEHRNLPVLDPVLFGECQAALFNLESLLLQEFGQKYALSEQLTVALQFSQMFPEEKYKAVRSMATVGLANVKDYVEKYRSDLPSPILNSMKYSFSVFLVPRVANRQNSADAAVQFIRVDEASEEELKRLEKLNVLIREKQIPISNLGLYKPSEVVNEVIKRIPYRFTVNKHVLSWKHFNVRPSHDDPHPERTQPEYCIYDDVHQDYVYTSAWVDKLCRELSNPTIYERITGYPPLNK